MARCVRTGNLDVHHIGRDGGYDIDNARVLYAICREETSTYGGSGPSPPDFSQDTRNLALMHASFRCECTSSAGYH